MPINKVFGTRKERELRTLLEKTGYCVTRAGGSLGMFDLIAINDKEVQLIQVKATHGKYIRGRAEMERIRLVQVPECCTKIWAEWKRREWHFKVIE